MTAPSLVRTLGGDIGFGEGSLSPNDDSSTSEMDITSVFENGLNFFGETYTSLWINNNGSVTFDGPLSSFTPSAISSGTTPGIFPFWGDVETSSGPSQVSPGGTSQGSDLVWFDFDVENDRFIVTWDDVGFYNNDTSRVNAFQLIIEDASDDFGRSIGDFDITFVYESIDWTTGDASGGSGGLGGTPARAGYSAGDENGTFFELPQSGLEDALRELETTAGNTGEEGLWTFEVRNGDVPQTVTIGGGGNVIEGDTGITTMTFTVQRFGETDGTLSVDWSAVGFLPSPADSGDVTGTLPVDGTVFFDEGVLTQDITLEITGDTMIEADEAIMVVLNDAVAVGGDDPIFSNVLGFGMVIDDDAPAPPPPPVGFEADIFGDPHLVTLDGLGYDFQAVGEFVLLESADSTQPLNVQIRTQPVSDVVSITTAVAIDMGGAVVELDSDNNAVLSVDGVAQNLTEVNGPLDIAGGGQVYLNDGMYTVVLPSGEQLVIGIAGNGSMNVCAFLSDDREPGSVQGLLGNADGLTGNDLALRDGTVLTQPVSFETLYVDFADSWRISDFEALFDRVAGETTSDWQDPSYPRGTVTLDDLPADLIAAAEAAVRAAGITDPILFEAAVLDFALTGDSAYIAGTTNVVATPTVETNPTGTPDLGTSLLIAAPGANPEGEAGVSSYIFTVDRFGDTSGELTVTYTIGGEVNEADIGGPLTGTVTFLDGETRQSIIVDVLGDIAVEADEALEVSLSVDEGTEVTFAAQSATVIVEDDDAVGVLIGTSDNDALTGDNTDNIVVGLSGDDVISGLGGSDQIFSGSGNDDISGGAGNDDITGESGNDTIGGGIGFDTISGAGGDDNIRGLDGFDLILGGTGNDTINGNNGFDTVNGGEGDDQINGGLSPDELNGGEGADTLNGQAGGDTLSGGAGDDVLSGNAGFDLLYGGEGDDVLGGGLANDLLDGGDGDDSIRGDNGFDSLDGGLGDDNLEGNSGNDTISGGLGDDTMRGGQGADTFVFTQGADVIRDYSLIVDRLELSSDLFSETNPVGSDIAGYASVIDGNTVFDFGDGNTLTLNGIDGNIGILFDDITFI